MAEAGDVLEVVEKLQKTGLQAAPPAHCYPGPGDVVCDFCTGRKRKAVKSCLFCLASYCETHLRPHKSPAFKKHRLAPATVPLQEKIRSLLLLCEKHEHKGHDTVPAAAVRPKKWKQPGSTQKKFQQCIQEKEKEMQEIRQAKDSLTRSAQAAVENSERILTELIHSFERRHIEETQRIRAQEKAEVSRVKKLLEPLEQEIAELKRRDAEVE